MKTRSLVAYSVLFALAVSPLPAQTNVFPSTGNVGVGTAAPAALLHLSGNSATKLLLDNGVILSQKNAAGAVHNLLTHYTDDNVYLDNPDGHLMFRATASTSHFIFQTGSGEKLRIDGSGNVGISTPVPQVKMDFGTSSNNVAQVLNLYTNGNARTGFGMDSATGGMRIYAPNYPGNYVGMGGITLLDSNQTWLEYLRVDTWNGNVGIGTSSSSAGLEISRGGGRTLLNLSYTPEPTVYNLQVNEVITASNVRWSFDQRNANTDYPNTLVFDRGNVGIGTTNPTHKLAVNGTIRAREVIVDTGWSDYVFADDYQLAPLSEVESHIRARGHLPGIPSAAEVAEHGVSMGEMQAKLLAKIEELTLHQIAHEKKIERLDAANQTLTATVKRLSSP